MDMTGAICFEEEKEIRNRDDWTLLNYLCVVCQHIGALEAKNEFSVSVTDKLRQAISKDEIIKRLTERKPGKWKGNIADGTVDL